MEIIVAIKIIIIVASYRVDSRRRHSCCRDGQQLVSVKSERDARRRSAANKRPHCGRSSRVGPVGNAAASVHKCTAADATENLGAEPQR